MTRKEAIERIKSILEECIEDEYAVSYVTSYDADALDMAIEALSCSENPNNSDCISRQAAIDIERNATVDTNPSHFEAHQKFTQFMDDAEISSFGRWQWSNGFNTALTAVGVDLKKLPSAQPEKVCIAKITLSEEQVREAVEKAKSEIVQVLPSAQPEIIHCKDCKWKQGAECVRFADVRPFPSDFCSRAERRTDDKTNKGSSC